MSDPAIETPVKRGPGRPKQNTADVRPPLRSEAKRSPLRERLHAKIGTVREQESNDRFFIPPEMIPDGVEVQWKRFSVYGYEDPYYIANLRSSGWEPMTHEDFPGLAPEGVKGPIIKDGQMLMGQAKELTERARAKMDLAAKTQIRDREAQLGMTPRGTLPRVNADMSGRRLGVQTEVMRPIAVED